MWDKRMAFREYMSLLKEHRISGITNFKNFSVEMLPKLKETIKDMKEQTLHFPLHENTIMRRDFIRLKCEYKDRQNLVGCSSLEDAIEKYYSLRPHTEYICVIFEGERYPWITREDIAFWDYAKSLGWEEEFAYSDVVNNRITKEKPPHWNITFNKGNKIIVASARSEYQWSLYDIETGRRKKFKHILDALIDKYNV